MTTQIGDWIEFLMGATRTLGIVRAIGQGEVSVDSNGTHRFVPVDAIREVRRVAVEREAPKSKARKTS